jgi:hypothetical protein
MASSGDMDTILMDAVDSQAQPQAAALIVRNS